MNNLEDLIFSIITFFSISFLWPIAKCINQMMMLSAIGDLQEKCVICHLLKIIEKEVVPALFLKDIKCNGERHTGDTFFRMCHQMCHHFQDVSPMCHRQPPPTH